MNPRERLFPGVPTSKTATQLLSALATKSVFSSGESARLLGVEPEGAWGYRAAQMVSTALPVVVSRTVTVFLLALATNKNFPERVSTISHGCSWVAQRPITWFDFRSMTATDA